MKLLNNNLYARSLFALPYTIIVRRELSLSRTCAIYKIDSYIIYLYKCLHSTLLQIRIHRLYSGVFVGGDPVKIVVHVSCVFIARVFLVSICKAE